ncbi:MAG: ParB-like nuclease domain-containing protein [Chloroflexi bacterium]|nr:ParB-like nuclease domain-containing protein [Chloroflexota bacterium]
MAHVIRTIDIEGLDHIPGNTNEMDEGEFNSLCEGIQESRFVPPPIVAPRDGRYVIIDGNHRKKAAALLGYTHLDCVVLTDLADTELQDILSARLNVVRGKPNKRAFTALWMRVRERLPENEAMKMLGVTSERRLHQLIIPPKRKIAAATVIDEEVKRMMSRARIVEDLGDIIRAAIGDGVGTEEFDYLAFQVRRSKILLVRCEGEELVFFQRFAGMAKEKNVRVAAAMGRALEEFGVVTND